jgi:hypothetical protein
VWNAAGTGRAPERFLAQGSFEGTNASPRDRLTGASREHNDTYELLPASQLDGDCRVLELHRLASPYRKMGLLKGYKYNDPLRFTDGL